MLSALLAGVDADDTGKTRFRVFQVVVVDVWSVGVSTAGVFVGASTENPRNQVKGKARLYCQQGVRIAP